ncbi:MAG: putative oxidoreductase [Marmoricola sp.]|nr:putative oxidoreductase [Marmoricola sp.]
MTAGTLTLAGREVPRLGYGTMRLTGPHIMGPPADRPEAVRVLRRAVELGVRVIDTAWYYGPYEANLVLAEALHPYADDLVIVTKLGGARRPDGSWYSALSAQELREGCEHDLRLLQLDAVPVAHLRWMPGAEIPFEDALGTMISLQDEGKIEHLGLSNVSQEQVELALTQTPIVTVSNAYSVLNRADEGLVERCEQAGIAYLPFFPLAASPVQSGAGVTGAGVVADVATRLQVSATQVALAWLLHRSPVMLPIPGTSSVAHLEDNLAAASLRLSPEDLAALDAA